VSETQKNLLFDAAPAAADRQLTDVELQDKVFALIAANGARGLSDPRLAVLAREPVQRVRTLRAALVAGGRVRGGGVQQVALSAFESLWIVCGQSAQQEWPATE
jgi:hypothetical protein